MTAPDFSSAAWRKSGRSGGSDGGGGEQCVEVAFSGGAVGVRDTKNRATRLTFSGAAFGAFVRGARRASG